MDISTGINLMLTFPAEVYQVIIKKLGLIDSFKGAWQLIENSENRYLKELRKIATIESTGSSTRIEGATLTDLEIETLLKSVKINKLVSRDEQEVIGYYEVLQVILDNYKHITFEERYIHQLHGMLLKHSDKDQGHKGKYKILANKVVANYPDGSQRIIFRTTEPHLTGAETQQLLFWVQQKVHDKNMHPIMLVAVFVYEFLSIHPYQDGNGRLSRLLTTLLLLQMDYQFVQYVSFEHIIESKKDEYYRALMEGQKNRQKKEERIDQWILFFLDSLLTLTQRLQAKYDTYNKIKLVLNERQQKVMAYISENEPVKIGGLEVEFVSYSRNTLKKDLAWLLKEGLIAKFGVGRGVHYHLKSDTF